MKHPFLPLAALFFVSTASAQYKGGSGTGAGIISASLLSLSAGNTMYSGGSNDGSSGVGISQLGMGTSTSYSGGSGDGNSSFLSPAASLATGSSYAGGSGEGNGSSSGSALNLIVNGMYNGGSNDGAGNFSSSALPLSSGSNYSGGADDGAGNILVSALSLNSAGMYAGGNNDGSGSVSVSALAISVPATMFSGGSGAGYSFTFAPAISVALPLSLEDFSVMHQQSDALLHWQVGDNRNEGGFEIERSYDGNIFVKAGFVKATPTLTSDMDYQYVDPQPGHYCPQGPGSCSEVYYRLKQVAADGRYSFSPVKRLSLDASAILADVYPNPASGTLNIRINSFGGPGANYGLTLYNSLGVAVFSISMLTQTFYQIDLQAYASGIYYLKLSIDGQAYPHQITIKH